MNVRKNNRLTAEYWFAGGTGCLASGSGKIYEKLKELTKDHTGVEVKIGEEIAHTKVMKSGCHGFCEMGPLVKN